MKICASCKLDKNESEFGIYVYNEDGLRRECKSCRRRKYHEQRDKMCEQKRIDYLKHKEKRQEFHRNRYQENPEYYIERSKEYYNLHKDEISEKGKRYREENKEAVALRKKEYADRKRQEKLEWLEKNLMTVSFPDTYKVCGRCKSLKEKSNFRVKQSGGLIAYCKTCEKEHNKIYYRKNKKSLSQKDKTRRSTPENKAYQKFRKQRYRKSPEGIKKIKEYKSKPNVRVADSCRSRLYSCIKNYRLNKKQSTFKYIGCSVEFLIKYLESKFREGMSWNNYGVGGWQIDHSVPCCSLDLTKQENIYKCFNYTNLQPLWDYENLSKASEDKELSISPL